MREVLERCIVLDEIAEKLFSDLARVATEPSIQGLFTHMAEEEREHLGWWRELLVAWDEDRLPHIFEADPELPHRLAANIAEIQASVPDDLSELTTEGMLALAAQVEYFALEPAIGELLDISNPDPSLSNREAYDHHLAHLIDAIEEHLPDRPLTSFLTHTVKRAWRDSKALADAAWRDPLTGLANRRIFVQHLKQWTRWSARYGRPLALCMLDIDDFKGINDTCGHDVGDVALKEVAAALLSSVRGADLVARLGGDEFIVVAPETDRTEVLHLVERIVRNVRAIELSCEAQPAPTVGVSIGSVVVTEAAGVAPRTTDELMKLADDGLYLAKQAGKDRWSEPIIIGRTDT